MYRGEFFPATLTRRSTLRAAAYGGLATFMGLPVRALMAKDGQGGTRRPAKADSVILLWMNGGMSHLDTLDPKPGTAFAGEFAAIRTSVDGVAVGEILPTVASQLHHATIVRSILGESNNHEPAKHHLLTSFAPVRELVHPSLGSIVAHQVERLGDLPAFVSVGGGEPPSAGYLGQAAEAYFIGDPGKPDPTIALPEGITRVRSQRRLAIALPPHGVPRIFVEGIADHVAAQPPVVAVAILGESIGSALIGAVVLGEVPGVVEVLGGAVVLSGVYVALHGARPGRGAPTRDMREPIEV